MSLTILIPIHQKKVTGAPMAGSPWVKAEKDDERFGVIPKRKFPYDDSNNSLYDRMAGDSLSSNET
jgi:hypothetical protein